MVLQFFNKSVLTEAEVEKIIYLLDTTESAYLNSSVVPEFQTTTTVESPTIHPNFECSFDAHSLLSIVHCVNELQIFREKVTYEDMASLFACKPLRKLTATNNGFVAVFFRALSARGLIVSNWQHVISIHKLILSSSRKAFLTQKSLSGGLYQYGEKQWSSKDDLLNRVSSLTFPN